MAQCVTCGSELHPDRATKYDYCMAPACQEKNLKGLTMVAVGVNKAAEQYLVLDEQTRDELASGKYHDQRRGSFGTSVPSSASVTSPASAVSSVSVASSASAATATRPRAAASAATATRPRAAASRSGAAQRGRRPSPRRPASPAAPRRPWSKSQEKLALLYNEQGLRPGEIADKLGLSSYAVTQIILTSRNRGKL